MSRPVFARCPSKHPRRHPDGSRAANREKVARSEGVEGITKRPLCPQTFPPCLAQCSHVARPSIQGVILTALGRPIAKKLPDRRALRVLLKAPCVRNPSRHVSPSVRTLPVQASKASS